MKFQRKRFCVNNHDTLICGRNKSRACKECDKDRYKNNKDRWRDKWRYSLYGINNNDYLKLLSNQNNCCAICNEYESIQRFILSIDHDHKTGKIRGLLCTNCNNGLGRFKDNAERLRRAAKYLESN